VSDFLAKVKIVLTAIPTYGAAAVAVLTVISTSVVPLLPVGVGVKVAAWIAAALGVIQAVVAVVKRVTPVEEADRGILPPVAVPEPWDAFWHGDA
jgi:hypothetical protein